MRTLLFLICSVFLSVNTPYILKAQSTNDFVIDGNLRQLGVQAKVLFIHKVGEAIEVDSTEVVNGKFSFKGKTDYPFPAQLLLSYANESISPDQVVLYIEPGILKIEGEDKISTARISGSKTNDLNVEFQHRMASIKERGESIQKTYENASFEQKNTKAFTDSLDVEYANVMRDYNNAALTFIGEHPDEILSAYMLRSELRMHPDNKAAQSAFYGLSETIQNTPAGKDIRDIIDKSRKVEIGKSAPDFTINDIYNNNINLSDFKGKYVLLNFWSPDCSNCVHEIPMLKESYRKYKDKNFVILGIAVEDESNRKKWLDTVKNYDLEWINASDLKMWQSEVLQLYNVKAVPHNLLIDPNGKIIAKELYGNNLTRTLEGI